MQKLEIIQNNTEKTLGRLIRDSRIEGKVSINQLSSSTKIHKSLLLHLENDRYDKLPKKVYIAGFLKLMSNYLKFDLEEAQDLLSKIEDQQTVSIRTWKKVKVLSYQFPLFYKRSGLFNNKIFTRCASGVIASGFFAFMLMGYGLRRPVANVKNNQVIKGPIPTPKELPAHMNPISLTIEALHGDSWIAYKVNNDQVVTFTLEKGKNLHLKANSIRLVLGNYSVLKITKDGEPFTYSGKLVKNVANIIFPEKLKDQFEKPYISFNKPIDI